MNPSSKIHNPLQQPLELKLSHNRITPMIDEGASA